jgi:hypothetical protein
MCSSTHGFWITYARGKMVDSSKLSNSAKETHAAEKPGTASAVSSWFCCRYYNVEIALNCGSMFRDCIRDETITG